MLYRKMDVAQVVLASAVFVISLYRLDYPILVFSTILLVLIYFRWRRASDRSLLPQNTPAIETPIHSQSMELSALESSLTSVASGKLKMLPILSDQLRAVITQTDEAAGNLISAFMGINKQAKDQLQLVQQSFGGLSNQNGTDDRNILAETQQRLIEIQTNINSLLKFFEETIKAVDEMGHSLERVKDFTQRISKIGNATHILSINAAIEAANAGEQGRGFSVVAREIKELAMGSEKSIHEIHEITDGLTERLQAMRQRFERARASAGDVSTRTNDLLTQAVQGLNAILDDTKVKMQAVATEAEQLSQSIGQVVMSIQFQDITRQRIEHVIEPLETLHSELPETLLKVVRKEINPVNSTGQQDLLERYTMASEREVLQKHS